MNPGWLVESASLWGYHGAMLAETRQALRIESVQAYWVSNRVRFDAWNAMMTRLKPFLSSTNTSLRTQAWSQTGQLVEEVLMSEPLSRICVAVAARLEDRHVDEDSRAILHNIFASHQDIRKRCLQWTLEGIDAGIETASRANRVRAYLEHWTDLLLGFFSDPYSANEYAFSPERVDEFAEDYNYRRLGDASETVWTLLLAGNRKWLSTHGATQVPHPELGRDVCQAALGMVHPAWFDSLGLLPSKAAQSIAQSLHMVDRTLESLVDGSWLKKSHVQTDRSGRFTV